jgi:hypothetical protein
MSSSPDRYIIVPSADTPMLMKFVFVFAIFFIFSTSVVYASIADIAYVPSLKIFQDIFFDDYGESVAALEEFIIETVERAPQSHKKGLETFETRVEPEPSSSIVDTVISGLTSRAASAIKSAEAWLAQKSLQAYSSGNTIRATRSR